MSEQQAPYAYMERVMDIHDRAVAAYAEALRALYPPPIVVTSSSTTYFYPAAPSYPKRDNTLRAHGTRPRRR